MTTTNETKVATQPTLTKTTERRFFLVELLKDTAGNVTSFKPVTLREELLTGVVLDTVRAVKGALQRALNTGDLEYTEDRYRVIELSPVDALSKTTWKVI